MSTLNFTEDSYEQTLISLFKDMGYMYECGYNIERDVRNPLYEDHLEGPLSRINKGVSSYGINELLKIIKNIDGANVLQKNEQFMNYLQNGVTVESPLTPEGGSHPESKEYRTVLAKLIDFEHPEMNDFNVVNQWTVEEYENKRADMVVFVNGLPLVVIELKSPSNDSVGDDDAYNQIKNYQDKIPCLFVYNCFNVLSDMLTTRAGTLTATKDRYMEWKTVDGSYESTDVADFHTFFEGIFQKDRFLDIIHNFICFDKWEGRTGKILAGYHQYYAVNKALQRTFRALDSDGKIGVFWHTQGSGKSLSMVFLAHLLVSQVPGVTIVVVTDRKDLDQQLFGQFARCQDFVRLTPKNAQSKDDLVAQLKDIKAGGLVFTTLQKFSEYNEPLSLRRNIIVVTDEAHRSQYGEEVWDSKTETLKKGLALKMREALPNASFIGFTGTPISTKDKDTQEVFGDYIDIYDMTQSVNDGATRPVYYESRVIKLHLDDETLKQLDKEFDELVEVGATDEQVEHTKQQMSGLEAVLSEDEVIDSLVRDIVEHYEDRQYNVKGKAMIVALTRSVGVKIYKKILELRPDWTEKVKVVMTSSNKDPEEWHSIIGNEATKKELARKFKDPNDEMKIAIVRDMWLTGFDVPSLDTMYVYKAMSGHNLMQAIARVNRVFPGKEGGLIVDYVGIAQALKKAMNDYTARDRKRFGDPNIAKTAYNKFLEELDICRDQIHGFDYKDFIDGDDAARAKVITDGLNFMIDPKREVKGKEMMKHAQLLYNAVTLCRSLLTREQKLEVAYFSALRVMLCRFNDNNNKKIKKQEISERINELMKQSIRSEGVINLFGEDKAEFSLFNEKFIEEVKRMKQKNIAISLLKNLLKDKLRKYKRSNVVQSNKFSELLNDSLNRYVKGLLTNEEVIQELLNMVKNIKQQEEEGNELGLSDEEKAFYDALSLPQAVKDFYTNDQLVALTHELTDALRRNRTIDWNQKESAQAKMRVMIKRLLKKYKYPPEGAEEAMQTVMDQCNNWANNEDNYYDADDSNVVPMDSYVNRADQDEYCDMAAEQI